uniref:Brix domain-containing protein n=1 Tax=Globisporangium ultimum (strain ATCC 200006 / CBS 805.95 / DAOM BR144) TaxID=431595 RepID=K3X086_GLOUD
MSAAKRRREADAMKAIKEADDEPEKKQKVAVAGGSGFINRQRVLVFSSRGITTRYRHLLDDFRKLLPHHKRDVKLDAKDTLHVVNEIAEIKGCNTTIFLEARKRQDLYMWVSRVGTGPSVKFLVQNVHTMDELKMTGNALIGSRPLLTFDKEFDELPHLQVVKKLFTQVWGTPKGHPKSKPFIDRVMSFYYADGKVWCRNFQLADEADSKKIEQAALHRGEDLVQLIEIGPRFVITPIRIFDGSFGGQTLYQNPRYVSPNETRRDAKMDKRDRYVGRKASQAGRDARKPERVHPEDQFADVFAGPTN